MTNTRREMLSSVPYETALDVLLNAIREDYINRHSDEKRNAMEDVERDVAERMDAEFVDSLHVKPGNKYDKIVTGNSVWGFIVATDRDKKFRKGDILKAASWKTPARNAARGNIFEDYEIRWTGPNYLR